MQITILSVSVETVPTAKGSYQKLEVAYKGEDGQVKGKKLVSFGSNAPAFKVLKEAESGQVYEVTSVKEGEFWQWTAASKATGATIEGTNIPQTIVMKPTNKITGSNYETPEERAKKQVYIIRQSSITAALGFLGGKSKSTDDVIQVAKEFEKHVMHIEPPTAIQSLIAMEDDIPQ